MIAVVEIEVGDASALAIAWIFARLRMERELIAGSVLMAILICAAVLPNIVEVAS